MTKYRSLLLCAAGLCCAVLAAWAEDRDDKGTKDKGGASGRGSAFQGRVAKVDADKMTIELRDAKAWAAGGTGGERDAKPARDKGRDADAGRSMTFKVGDRATITLDGKEAKLSDIKADAWARVHAGGAGGTGRDKGTDRDGKGTADKGGDSGTGAGGTLTATKVEVFTKDPGTGGTRDSGTKDRGRDKE